MALTTTLPAAPGPLPPTRRRAVLAVCALGTFAANLPAIPMTVAVPTIAESFGIAVPSAQWIMTAHFVALAATMLPVGAAADLLGRWRVYFAGLVVLMVSVALTPLAWGLDALVVLRAVQGVGAGMIMVASPGICAAAFPEEERGRAMGTLLLGGWLASGLGPPLFGALVQSTVWYAGFLTILLPTAVALAVAFWLRPADTRTSGGRTFDPMGSVLLVMAFGLVVIGAGHGQEEHWEPIHTATHVGPLFLVSFGSAVLYVMHARRAAHPILPLQLFRSVTLTTASITNGLVHMTMLMTSFLMPFYLQNVLGYSPFEIALMLLSMGAALNVMALPSGWIYDRFGSKGSCTVAMVLGSCLLLSYLGLNEHSTLVDILPRLVLTGVVLGLFVTPNVSAMLASVPAEHYSLTAGLEQTSRNLGHALGVVVSSGVAAFVVGPVATGATAADYVAVVHGASAIGGIVMGAGVVLALLRDERERRPHKAAPQPAPVAAPASASR